MAKLEITELFYPKTRQEWYDWLKKNHRTKSEIWLQRYKKATGKPSISYDDLVEVGLCFGWNKEPVKSRREEAQKRLDYLIKMTKQGKMYGSQPLKDILLE